MGVFGLFLYLSLALIDMAKITVLKLKKSIKPKTAKPAAISIFCLDSEVVSSHSLTFLKTSLRVLSVISFIKKKNNKFIKILKYFVTKKK